MKDNTNKKFWDRFAKLYTPIQERQNAKMYTKIVEDISGYFDDDKRVLELGMGTGQFTFSLCDRVREYIATDYSEKMISEAKKIRDDNVKYAIEDATSLTFDDKSFDVVLSANMLHIMPYPDSALSEIHRVLRDDGIAILPTFIYEGKMNKTKLWFMARVGFKVFHKWNHEEYKAYVERVGFEVISSTLYPSAIGPECVLIVRKASDKNI